jgi:hypothetical protein
MGTGGIQSNAHFAQGQFRGRSAGRAAGRPDGDTIDRKADVLCALSELRDRLRAGDVWVGGSRQYQDFESYLVPKATFALLKAEGPLPLAIEIDADLYLAGQLAERGGCFEWFSICSGAP